MTEIAITTTPSLDTLMSFAEFTVLTGIPNIGTRDAYHFALQRFFSWYRAYNAQEGAKFDRTAIMTYLALPDVQALASSTRNGALAAIKRLAKELYYRQMIPFETWRGIVDLRSEKQRNNKAPNWLTAKQLDELMQLPDKTLHGLRNRAILAIATGCGLRRTEICDLKVSSIEQRTGRWVFVVKGKGGKTRFATVPNGVKVCIDLWLGARGCQYANGKTAESYYLVCPVLQGDVIKDRRLSDDVIYDVVREYGSKIGIPGLLPHDLRRTYAKLTRGAGADLDQIQFSMGHEDIKTTQRYIGDSQNFVRGPGDYLDTNWTGETK